MEDIIENKKIKTRKISIENIIIIIISVLHVLVPLQILLVNYFVHQVGFFQYEVLVGGIVLGIIFFITSKVIISIRKTFFDKYHSIIVYIIYYVISWGIYFLITATIVALIIANGLRGI